MRVLVVDHDRFIQTIYESALHQQNIDVDLAANGVDAILKIEENIPNVILTELVLPKKNGFDLIANLKKDKKYKKIPILVLSKLSQKKDIDEAMSLGVTKYLIKDDCSQKRVVEEILNVLMTKES